MIFSSPYITVLAALILTIIVEGAAILIIKRRKEYFGYSVLVNMITNPVINVTIMMVDNIPAFWGSRFFTGYPIAPYVLVMEAAAVVVEAFCYRGMTGMAMKKALGLSLILNLLSFAAGLAAEAIYWESIW